MNHIILVKISLTSQQTSGIPSGRSRNEHDHDVHFESNEVCRAVSEGGKYMDGIQFIPGKNVLYGVSQRHSVYVFYHSYNDD